MGEALFTEKELHCMARIVQGMIFFHEMFHVCKYCKYACECGGTFPIIQFDTLRKKLEEATGIYLGMHQPGVEELAKEN